MTLIEPIQPTENAKSTAIFPKKQIFRARFAVGSAFFLHGLCFSSWGARIPAIQQKLMLSEAQLGTVLFALPVGLLFSMPLTSWLIHRFGSRTILVAALLLYPSMLISLGLATRPASLMLLLLVFGMISNMVNVSVNTQAVAVESLYRKSIMASFHGFWSLAGFVGAAIGTVMIGFNILPAWHFVLIFSVSVLVVIANFRKFLGESEMQATVPSSPAATNETKHSIWQRFKLALPNRELFILGLIAFFSMVCEGTMFDWSGVYFQKVVAAEQAWIGAGYTAFMSTMAGTRFIADRFVSHYGLKRILQASGLLTMSGLALSVAMPQLPTALLGFLMIGMGVSAVVPLTFSAAGSSGSRSTSLAIATVSSIGFIGFLIGPPMIGWIAGASSLRVSFAIVAVMGLCITWLAQGVERSASTPTTQGSI